MRCKHDWRMNVCIGFFVLLAIPLGASAQQEGTQLPPLLSTGLPATETPEEILPGGAVGYLRVNNLMVLLENIDSLLTAFVPENALPPELQPIFENPQPLIALLGMQAFGQPVELSGVSNLIGIALDRPLSLALYPMPKGFVLSVPIAHATVITGMIEGILRPKSVEKGDIGNVGYYHVLPSNRDMPPEIYIMASESTAFFCGSFDVAQMLVNSENMEIITANPGIAKGIEKYADRDLTLVASPGFITPQLPFFKEQFAQALIPVFQEIRHVVEEIPPAERFLIDARLRLELGVDGLDQFLDYAEAYASGIYRVLLDKVMESLTNLEGLALAINLEEKYQNLALTLFSQDIQVENFTRPLAMDELKRALQTLPGDKNTLIAFGQTPETRASKLFVDILNEIEEELNSRELPTDSFLAFNEYYRSKQRYSSLESKVNWTLKTLLAKSEKTDFHQFDTLWELLEYAMNRLSFSSPLVSMTLMPSVEEGMIEQHFANKADIMVKNEQRHQAMHEELPFKQPWFILSSRFRQEDMGEDVKKLTLEKVYTTQRGFFGYQQHELINRRIMFHKKHGEYELLYDAGADASRMTALLSADTHPVAGAVITLLDQAPEGINAVSLFRALHLVSDLVEVLGEVETLIHREIDAFLVNAQEIVDTYDEEEFETRLLESKFDLPLLMASLNLDEDGKVYCTLPGGLHYPRPEVMPKVKELFADFLAAASDVGGSASFMAVQQGEFELSSVQSTEALALLGKTVVNNFHRTYMASPEGMELLMTTLGHPADFQDLREEQIFAHPLWEAVQEGMFPRF